MSRGDAGEYREMSHYLALLGIMTNIRICYVRLKESSSEERQFDLCLFEAAEDHFNANNSRPC